MICEIKVSILLSCRKQDKIFRQMNLKSAGKSLTLLGMKGGKLGGLLEAAKAGQHGHSSPGKAPMRLMAKTPPPPKEQPVPEKQEPKPQDVKTEEQEVLDEAKEAWHNIDELRRDRRKMQMGHREWILKRKQLICQVKNETNLLQNPNKTKEPRHIGFTLETL